MDSWLVELFEILKRKMSQFVCAFSGTSWRGNSCLIYSLNIRIRKALFKSSPWTETLVFRHKKPLFFLLHSQICLRSSFSLSMVVHLWKDFTFRSLNHYWDENLHVKPPEISNSNWIQTLHTSLLYSAKGNPAPVIADWVHKSKLDIQKSNIFLGKFCKPLDIG
jgi:hypothetical protein